MKSGSPRLVVDETFHNNTRQINAKAISMLTGSQVGIFLSMDFIICSHKKKLYAVHSRSMKKFSARIAIKQLQNLPGLIVSLSGCDACLFIQLAASTQRLQTLFAFHSLRIQSFACFPNFRYGFACMFDHNKFGNYSLSRRDNLITSLIYHIPVGDCIYKTMGIAHELGCHGYSFDTRFCDSDWIDSSDLWRIANDLPAFI